MPALPQELPPGVRWMTPITAAPTSVPVISGDRVFLASLPGVVSVHDIKDGRELWREPINPEQPIAVEGPLVFIASGEAIQALQVSDRAVAWRASTGTITAPLTVKEGWVIAASETRMVALRASDGSKVWERANGATARAGGDRRQHAVRAARQRPHSGDRSRRWQTTLGAATRRLTRRTAGGRRPDLRRSDRQSTSMASTRPMVKKSGRSASVHRFADARAPMASASSSPDSTT